MFDGLGYEESIEGVAMVTGKTSGTLEGGPAERNEFESHRFESRVKFLIQSVGKAYLSKTGFDCQFPWCNGAHHGAGFEALDEVGSFVREGRSSFEEPDYGI